MGTISDLREKAQKLFPDDIGKQVQYILAERKKIVDKFNKKPDQKKKKK